MGFCSPVKRRTHITKDVNKKYKDTVFRRLFGEAHNALSLYNSLNGTAYTDEAMLEYNTLENAIYMNFKNDISFLIAHHMNLYEHQSTINPNMPLRDLIYISEQLQVYIKELSIYSTKLQRIPTPSFVVFYNGSDEMPEKVVLRLSDAFEVPVEDPELELKVTVYNINSGKNEELKKKCPVLAEYMTYIDKVRKYADKMELKEAVEAAINECIREHVLVDFLKQQKAEVIMLSIYEYDEERELKLIRADERELGREEGLKQGMEQGMEQGVKVVIEMCWEIGFSEEQIISEVAKRFAISEEVARNYIQKTVDKDSLQKSE